MIRHRKKKQANVCTDNDQWEYGFAAVLLACAVIASIYIHPRFQSDAPLAIADAVSGALSTHRN